MGNCCVSKTADISKEQEPALRKVTYASRNDMSGHTTTGGGRSQVELQQTIITSGPGVHGHSASGDKPDHRLEESLHYPKNASGEYYQPDRPFPYMDPMTGIRTSTSSNTSKAEAVTPKPLAISTIIVTTSPARESTSNVTSTPPAPATSPSVSTTMTSSPAAVPSSKMTSEPARQQSCYEPRDVMISYSRSDIEVMQKIRARLEAEGITVWVDVVSIEAGADFLSKIGEAIIDAKLFVCILSEKAVKSKYCRDEVALAYVSNTTIYPVNLLPRNHLLPLMDTGLKLQLANYNWTSLTEPDTLEDTIGSLVAAMKAELDDLRQLTGGSPLSSPPTLTSLSDEGDATDVTEKPTSVDDVIVTEGTGDREERGGDSPATSPVSDRGQSPEFTSFARRMRQRNRAAAIVPDDDISNVMPEQFWTEKFGVSDYVIWDRFTSAFLEAFKGPVEEVFTAEDQQQLMDILKRELEVETDDRLYKYQLVGFCSIHGETSPVWQRVQEQARENFAMREVFNMDSSVRVEAIENLGKFRSAVVIDALRDLLTDLDANVRAVATVSLSRTNANDPVTIRHVIRTLNDKDRLVREAGCLALGHLKARQAVSKLTHLWRNDVISHVREAAAVALRQIGGQEVEDVMRVTRVLAEEIRALTEMES